MNCEFCDSYFIPRNNRPKRKFCYGSECNQQRKSVENKHSYIKNGRDLNKVKERKARNRDILAQIKLESGCVDCGYNKSFWALHFDHLDPCTKSFQLSNALSCSIKRLLEEVAKCEVVCANCHAIRTSVRAGWAE